MPEGRTRRDGACTGNAFGAMTGRPSCKRARGAGVSSGNRPPESEILPGLPNDVAHLCLAKLPRASLHELRVVSRAWRSAMAQPRFQQLRVDIGATEEWLYVETWNQRTRRVSWFAFEEAAGKWLALPPIPRKRGTSPEVFGRGSATFRGHLLVMGGKAGPTGPTLRDLFIYSPFANRWRRGKGMIHTRHSPLVTVLRGKVFVLGGFDCLDNPLQAAECYDLDLDLWSSVPSHDPPQLASPNSGYHVGWQPNWLAISLADDKFYCSYNDDSRDVVKLYDPGDGAWHPRSSKMKALLRYGLSTVLRGKLHTLDWAAGRVRVADEQSIGWIYLQGLSCKEMPWVQILRDNPRIAGLDRKLYVVRRFLQIFIVNLDAGAEPGKPNSGSVYRHVPGVLGAKEEEVISCQVLVA